MRFDERLLEILSGVSPKQWEGHVFRHMFADFPPDVENTSGARWNPPEIPAIYTSLSREVVLAEAEYQIAMQPLRPKARRTVYKMSVRLASVLDISDERILTSLGLTTDVRGSMETDRCQHIGGSAEHLGHDGLIVPSARAHGLNLVIYPNKTVESVYQFEVVGADVIDPGVQWR